MIGLPRGLTVFMYGEPVDMRKSFDTLSALVTQGAPNHRRSHQRRKRLGVQERGRFCQRSNDRSARGRSSRPAPPRLRTMRVRCEREQANHFNNLAPKSA